MTTTFNHVCSFSFTKSIDDPIIYVSFSQKCQTDTCQNHFPCRKHSTISHIVLHSSEETISGTYYNIVKQVSSLVSSFKDTYNL